MLSTPSVSLIGNPLFKRPELGGHASGGDSIIPPIGADGRALHEFWNGVGAIDASREDHEQGASDITPNLKALFAQNLAAVVGQARAAMAARESPTSGSVDRWPNAWASKSLADARAACQSLIITDRTTPRQRGSGSIGKVG